MKTLIRDVCKKVKNNYKKKVNEKMGESKKKLIK